MNLKEAIKREDNDDHLTDEERKSLLVKYGIEFTEDNFNEKYVDFIFEN